MTPLLKHRPRRPSARGASAVEYALLALLIAAAIVVAVLAFGTEVTGLFSGTASSVEDATSS